MAVTDDDDQGGGGLSYDDDSEEVTAGVAELHDTLKVEVEFFKKSRFCGFRVQKK